MAENNKKKNIDVQLSASLGKFGLRGRGRGRGVGPSRLPSLKPDRDLTLGGKPKRTFTPNIVARGVKKEETREESNPRYGAKRDRGAPRSRGRNRGRGRGRGDIVYSSGVFSQGPAAQQTLAHALGGGGGFNRGASSQDNDAGSTRANITTSKGKCEDELESDKILEMLKDEGKIELNEEELKFGALMPITLPLASKLVHKIKQDDVKTESELSQDEEEPIRFKPKPVIKQPDIAPPVEIADLFKSDAPDGQLFFLQFPDTLPIKPISHDEPVKTEPGTSTTSEETAQEDEEDLMNERLKKFTFQNVSEGYIGKLQIHESGKVKIRLGNVVLDVSLGTPCGFLQDLVSVHTEHEPAEMVSLGHVNHRLIATPNFESLLGSLES